MCAYRRTFVCDGLKPPIRQQCARKVQLGYKNSTLWEIFFVQASGLLLVAVPIIMQQIVSWTARNVAV